MLAGRDRGHAQQTQHELCSCCCSHGRYGRFEQHRFQIHPRIKSAIRTIAAMIYHSYSWNKVSKSLVSGLVALVFWYAIDSLNSPEKRGKLILPQPVTGSQPLVALNPARQQRAWLAVACEPEYAQQLLAPEVTSLNFLFAFFE